MASIPKAAVGLAHAVEVGHIVIVDLGTLGRAGRVVLERTARDGEAEGVVALKVNGVVAAGAAPRRGAEVVAVVAEHVEGARVADGRIAVAADGAVLGPDDDEDVLAVLRTALLAASTGVALVGDALASLDDAAGGASVGVLSDYCRGMRRTRLTWRGWQSQRRQQ